MFGAISADLLLALYDRDKDSTETIIESVPRITLDKEFVDEVLVQYGYHVGESSYGITYHVNHPAFDAVKNWLIARGYIEKPGYEAWNSCTVIKPFYFNNIELSVGETFYDAAAWKHKL